jgi:hypothetical protein
MLVMGPESLFHHISISIRNDHQDLLLLPANLKRRQGQFRGPQYSPSTFGLAWIYILLKPSSLSTTHSIQSYTNLRSLSHSSFNLDLHINNIVTFQ